MILADAHVHIYDCFDLEGFLNAAYSNFQSAADRLGRGDEFTPVLLLTETENDRWFDRLTEYADGKNKYRDGAARRWEFHKTGENESLCAGTGRSKALFIIAGRQVETAEGLEVLALCTTTRFRSGTPLIPLVEKIRKQGAIPVIPWGFGKWFGKRGSILADFLNSKKNSVFFLGESGGRPRSTPRPSHFRIAEKRGIRILPGTDPLPIKSGFQHVASFGFSLNESCSEDKPARDLKEIILDSSTEIRPYGQLTGLLSFIRNQFSIRMKSLFED